MADTKISALTPSSGVTGSDRIPEAISPFDGTSNRYFTPDQLDSYLASTVQNLTNKTLTSPILLTPVLGVATATSINGLIFTSSAATLTLTTGKVFSVNNTLTLAGTDSKVLTLTNSLTVAGNDGTISFNTPASTITFQGTDTYIGKATTDILTNKTYDTAGTGNVFKINGNTITSNVGTGAVNVLSVSPAITGSSTNDNAASGIIGEFISSNVAAPGSGITSGASTNITSISLTAGDWDVSGNIGFVAAASTTISIMTGSIGTTSASLGTAPNSGGYTLLAAAFTGNGQTQIIPVGPIRISLSGTTTVFLVANITFAVSTCTAYGFLGARRRR